MGMDETYEWRYAPPLAPGEVLYQNQVTSDKAAVVAALAAANGSRDEEKGVMAILGIPLFILWLDLSLLPLAPFWACPRFADQHKRLLAIIEVGRIVLQSL